ncbi:MAG: hypothetical protein HY097_08090 [Nitrospinae bacterium]|nr:hypothetical protein [Nitrospinota bacterium]MBI3812961.1 hypothetical protein [Nitrospinota bacterium]
MTKRMYFPHFDYSTLEFLSNLMLLAIITGIAILIFLILTASVASCPII